MLPGLLREMMLDVGVNKCAVSQYGDGVGGTTSINDGIWHHCVETLMERHGKFIQMAAGKFEEHHN